MPDLIKTISDEQAQALGGESIRFSSSAMAVLHGYHWPGNVRELRNYIERCQILMPGEELTAGTMLPPDQTAAHVQAREIRGAPPVSEASQAEAASFHEAREAFERTFLLQHLEKHAWNISRTAAEIGMERSQLHRKIKSFGLQPPEKESV